ncbi:MAG: hypothetical protein ACJAQW_000514, partial [Paracoccaceae bacterium]
ELGPDGGTTLTPCNSVEEQDRASSEYRKGG